MVTLFSPATSTWFAQAFEAPTKVQTEGWRKIAEGSDTLLVAPTGSGKTLAAFLWAIDRLGARAEAPSAGTRVLYISPLKALVHDIERNLQIPLEGIRDTARAGDQPFRVPSVAMRTGDTSQRARRAQLKAPPQILVTTPESLFLLLTSQAQRGLSTVETVIVDEIHALAPTKRGAHLALSLERLAAICAQPPQRIGLSATARPIEAVARFLSGGRPVAIVDASAPPALDLQIVVPVRDLARPQAPHEGAQKPTPSPKDHGENGMGYGAFQDAAPPRGIWSAIQPKLLALVQAHRSTIVFVNSRSLCERLARRLNEMAGADPAAPLARAHHGSVSHAQRREIEEALKGGLLRAIIATSSLELGIDMGAVDLVIQVESPRSTARGLQRIGRAGHQVGERSRGRLFPKHQADLLEAAVVCQRMLKGELEPLRVPRNALDVLSQQIVAIVSQGPIPLVELETLVRGAWGYRGLSRGALVSVLDMLSGRYPSTAFADLRPRIDWDRQADVLTGRPGAKMLAIQNAGTIPDRGLFTVHLGPGGPRIGELDEEMVHESRVGETFVLGASTWRVLEITRDKVIVAAAPGVPGRMPFWHGEGPGRPIELGRALGEFLREISSRDGEQARNWLAANAPLDPWAVENLVRYVEAQRDATGAVPTDRVVVVERFKDEMGDWRICILTPFGGQVHAPWAIALEAVLGRIAGFEVRAMWSDDGIALQLADLGEEAPPPDLDTLLPDPDELDALLVEQIGNSALFASLFRENAGRALLLPRRRNGARTPLWAQRLRAQNLMAAARQHPSFPIVIETYRQALQDHFDVPALRALLGSIRDRSVRVHAVETRRPSPFARSLVFRYVAQYMYEGDVPVAERRAQALSLDLNLLHDLLGQDELRDLLDGEIIAEVERDLQGLSPDRKARSAAGLHDLLRRVGDLSFDEICARIEPNGAPFVTSLLDGLERAGRITQVALGGGRRWVAAEDAGRYRDGLAAPPLTAIAPAFTEDRVPDALDQLLRRFGATHGPFVLEQLAARWDLTEAELLEPVAQLVGAGVWLEGAFLPGGSGLERCDPAVLRRIRQRTLAKLRGEIAPVEGPVLARFLTSWHGIGAADDRRDPLDRLQEAIEQLEGVPLPFSELERSILPARVPGFQPRHLDSLGASGEVVWIGCGALGQRDGRIALFTRARLAALRPEIDAAPEETVHRALLAQLGEAGACFLSELLDAAPGCGITALNEALWDLAWAGHITNDTFAPLRALAHGPSKSQRPKGRPGRGARRSWTSRAAGGRWSLVRRHAPEPNATEWAHTRTLTLLERHGILSRAAIKREQFPGGFGALYPVLRAMEAVGQVRRGFFVDGLEGAQFASPGAVERLRAARRLPEHPLALLLATTDPANPYGAQLPWPAPTEGGRPVRRSAACAVVLVDGEPVLHLSRGSQHVTSFSPLSRPHIAAAAIEALKPIAQTLPGRTLTIERLDDQPAARHPLIGAFVQAGFRPDYKGVCFEAPFT